MLVEALERPVGDLVDASAFARVVSRQDHVRLEQRAEDVDPLVEQLPVDGVEDERGDVVAALDRVRAVLEHLGLDDRDESGLLAQRCVAGQRVGVGPDAVVAGQLVA